ncbi:hypothetical protein MPSEU_001079900 [Mayamaea pseudoterrestris]|nr:hypothetical protein MPSEU_001079900 [Mayamaea pseudoterrestris]
MNSMSYNSDSDDKSSTNGSVLHVGGGSSNLSTSNATSMSGQELLEEKDKMFQTESRQVVKLKRVVLLIMVLAAIGISSCVYVVMSQAQKKQQEGLYYSASAKLLSTFQEIATNRLAALGSLSAQTTAYAIDGQANKTWPFVAVSWWQQRCHTILSLSGALYIRLNPFIPSELRAEWEKYSFNSTDAAWHAEGLDYQKALGFDKFGFQFDPTKVVERTTIEPELILNGLANHIYRLDEEKINAIIEPSTGPYLVGWQMSPVFVRTLGNRNLLTDPESADTSKIAFDTGTAVVGGMEYAPDSTSVNASQQSSFYSSLLSIQRRKSTAYISTPVTRVFLPVWSTFDRDTRKPVALLSALIRWESYFVNVLPEDLRGITIVLDNQCEDVYTFSISGREPTPVGLGDLHDPKFSRFGRMASFDDIDAIDDGSHYGVPLNHDNCTYTMTSYPSQEMVNEYQTNLPALVTLAVALVFAFTLGMFLLYDKLVERRQTLVLRRAEQTTAIVQSLFPKKVAEKLIQQKHNNDILASTNQKLNKFLEGDEQGKSCLADLFPACTVLFADISGFTAWSSTRDPSQVFHLLESIYNAFDALAKARKVFKVETIGDCYVAVTGLPDPQPNHAVIMARFASECMIKLKEVTQMLEITLGPDTTSLSMRVGLHSGPVTAGVLRGAKSRFQLFGDTVNTASRMESTGEREKIQVSQETANMLTVAGKSHWLTPRKDTVNAKGKGVLQTYWLRLQSKQSAGSIASSGGTQSSDTDALLDADVPIDDSTEAALKHDRKVDWMTELLGDFLKQIVAKQPKDRALEDLEMSEELIGINEIVEAISLPRFDANAPTEERDWRTIQVHPVVSQQLRDLVSIIASMYRNNPFHNFEHACHVTMSIAKHLKRIVTPDLDINEDEKKACSKNKSAALALLHDYTHGINSDAIAHFAIIFSGLIHDVDHRGISNAQLEKEEPALAKHFQHKSLAEQNSLEIAWTLFMSDQFTELRQCLFCTKDDFLRFRSLLVNQVMATDIFDKELNALRKARWDKAWSEQASGYDMDALRATIVLEHIIQASDVAHTMQHWHIYRKWNRLLFHEMMIAFRAGRLGTVAPSAFWYQGELGFFDGYIIPLAKKLKDCKVFGVNSDECLNYAMRNRAEWEVRGEEIVSELVREFADMDGPGGDAQYSFV